MKDELMGRRRGEWVAYLRTVHQRNLGRNDPRSSNYDDGMCHGIIPFGAVHHLLGEAERRLAQTLSRPLLARIVENDETGTVLAVQCPYCDQEHRHLLIAEEWDPEQPLQAACWRGTYRITLASGSAAASAAGQPRRM